MRKNYFNMMQGYSDNVVISKKILILFILFFIFIFCSLVITFANYNSQIHITNELVEELKEVKNVDNEKNLLIDTKNAEIEQLKILIAEKEEEIKKMVKLQSETEKHVTDIETELNSIKDNFELYKKEFAKADKIVE